MASLQPGEQLLHFKIEEMIGRGGMGEVYKAHDLKLGRAVAIKVLPSGTTETLNARKRFLQEARSASSLNHPNVVTIHSIETIKDMDFIVMEYVEGKKLNHFIAEGELDFLQILELGSQIAEAVSAAHSAGIIHRDIKSDNILITPRGSIKILDFGLAKNILTECSEQDRDAETIEHITEAGTMLGTVHYMSPEQTRGEPLDPGTDVFSIGCVLYQCATGKLPFQGPTIPSVLYQICHVDPAVPSTLRPDLPAAFDALISKSIAKDKQTRFANGTDLAREILAIKEMYSTKTLPTLKEEFRQASPNLVGREIEMKQLFNSLQAAADGNGCAIFISGEPGIGKTSLAEEFLRVAQKQYPQLIITRGSCVEQYGTEQAYLPFLESVGSLLNGLNRDRLIQALRLHAPTWHAQFPSAFESTGAIERSRLESIGASKERMLREMANALFHFTASAPLILFLEDLHWADPSSVDLLRYLAQALKGHRLMLLGTFRTAEVERANAAMKAALLEMRSHRLLDEIPLEVLNRADILHLMNTSFPKNTFSEEAAGFIYTKSEGHPLFVTSLLQFLVSQSVILQEENQWTIAQPFSEIKLEVPGSVSSMIRKKLDGLNDDERKMLQYASVEGEEFSSTVLAELLGADEADVEESLKQIKNAHGVVRIMGEEEFPDGSLASRYRFAHALYQNALYEDLVSKRRIQLHRMVGESLMKHFAAKAETISYRLGEHFRLGREFEKAAEFLQFAADNAKAIYANKEATGLYEKAIEQLNEIRRRSDDAAWATKTALLHEKRGAVLALSGQQENARAEYAKAMKFIPSADHIWAARLHRRTAKALETQQQFLEALKTYQTAEDIIDRDKERTELWWEEWLQIGLDRLWLHYTRNEVAELEMLKEKIEPSLDPHGTPSQRARFFFGILLASYRRDRYWIEAAHLENCARFLVAARESRNLQEIAGALFATGFAYLWKGELDTSLDYLKQAQTLAEKIGDAVLLSRCWTYFAILERKRKNREAVREYDSRALEVASSLNMREYVAVVYANEAWLALLEENWQEVREKAQQAISIWSSLTLVYPFDGLALWPLIFVEVRSNQIEKSIEYVHLLLDTSQQKLPAQITELLSEAAENWQSKNRKSTMEALALALDLARLENYL